MYLSRPRLAPSIVSAAAFGCLLAFGASAAHATTYDTYSDPTAFLAAVPALSAYAFPVGDGSSLPRPYEIGPVGFSTLQHFTHPFLEDDGSYGAGQTYLALVGTPAVNAAVQPIVSSPIYALGFDLGTFDGADTITLTMNFYDVVGTFTTSGGAGTSAFIGITSSDPIQQVSFTAANGTEIDFLGFYAPAAAVPEPSTALLSAAGLLVLAGGACARRRKS